MEQERNIVSIQEAVAISNYKSQRELMMNILRKDTSQSLGSISYALNSEDTETSHYAATALRDELGDFRSNVLKLYKNVKKGEKAEPSQLCEFIEKTYGMICQDVFLPTEKRQYTGMIDEIMKIMLADYKDDIKPQYYEWIVRCMIENDNKESAKEWCELAEKNLPGLLTPYKCYLRYYYYCDDGTDFIKTIDELKNTDIPIDNDTLEIFRMFG